MGTYTTPKAGQLTHVNGRISIDTGETELQLQVGEQVAPGSILQIDENAEFEILFDDGTSMSNVVQAFTPDTEVTEDDALLAEIDAIQQQILEGEDPTDGPETAAGTGGNVGHGGFTDIGRDGNQTQASAGYDTSGAAPAADTQGQPVEFVATQQATLTLQLDAPQDTSDTTPTITGTTNAAPGSVVTLVVTDADNNQQTITAVVGDDGNFSAEVETALAEGGYQVEGSVTDNNNNTATDDTAGDIDTTSPTVTVVLDEDTNNDGFISNNEQSGDANITVTLGSETEVGDILVVTDNQGDELFNGPVTQEMLDNGLQLTTTIPAPGVDLVISATVTDAAGNTTNTTDNAIVTGAVDDNALIPEDATATGNVLTNDTGNDSVVSFSVDTNNDGIAESFTAGETVTIQGVGTITLNPNGSYTFEPAENWNGQVPVINYTTNTGSSADLIIDIEAVDDASVLVNDAQTVDEDTTATGNVLDNDSDVDNQLSVDSFSVDIDGDGSAESFSAGQTATIEGVGTITIGSDGEYTFVPAKDWNGQAPVITYVTNTGSSATLTLNVTPVDDPSVLENDKNTVDEDTTATGNVLDNDFDVDNELSVDSFTLDINGSGEQVSFNAGQIAEIEGVGTITINSDGNYTFTPVDDWNGQVPVITYITNTGSSATLELTVTPVNDAPVTGADAGSVDEDATLTVDADEGVLSNDSDVDGDALSVSGIKLGTDATDSFIGVNGATQVATEYGTLTINADGSYSFTANGNSAQSLATGQTATVVFTYTANDGTVDVSNTLTITITGTNDAPVLSADVGAVNEDAVLTVSANQGVLSNDFDVDNGDELSVNGIRLSNSDDFTAVTAGTGTQVTTAYGTLTINADGSYSFNANGNAAQALAAGETATVSFVYSATDGQANVSETLTITITGTNDLPEISDSSKVADSVTEAGHKTENGQQDEVTGKQTATGTISASDVDQPSGTPLEFKVQSLDTDVAKYGEFKLDGNTWTFTLDDTKAAVQALKEGQTETLTFVIRVTDEKGGWVDQTVTVTINGTNDLPEISDSSKVADSVTEAGHKTENGQQDEVTGKQTATGTISASDVDQPSGTPLEFKVQSLDTDVAKYGEFKLDGNTWTFTLDDTKAAVQALKEGQTETLTFVIRVTDEKGGWVDQTVTVTINGTNDLPEIGDSSKVADSVTEAGHKTENGQQDEVTGKQTATGTISASDVDQPSGTPLEFKVQSLDTDVAKYGEFKLDGNTWTFTLDDTKAAVQALKEGQTETLTFVIRVTDEKGGWVDQTVTVTINGTNDLPEIGDSSKAADSVTEAGHKTENGQQDEVTGKQTATGTISASDVDQPSGTPLEFKVQSLDTDVAKYGEFKLDGNTWTFTLDDTKAAVQALKEGQTETLTFVIRVTDEKGGWVDQTVTVTINGTNDLPEIGDSSKVADSVTEAGHKTENGQQDEVTGKQTATGTISASDVDQPSGTPLEFKVQSLDTDVAKYGEFKLDGNAWTFTLDDTKAAVQALKEGQTETLTFVIRVTDEKGGWVDQTVTVTINGTNDLPEISDSSKVADSVTEAGHKTENGQQDEVTGKQTATGTISASDVDQPSGTPLEFKVQSLDTDVAKYGEFKLDGNTWTFTLDDTKAAVQALKEGQTETLTFVIRVTDEKGGWVDQTVTVTINGTNDLPEIGDSSKVADSVTEAGHKTENGQQDEVTGKQTATGTISASDVDQPSGTPLEFKVQSLDTDVAKYGEFKLDGNTWTFTLDDTKAAVQALKEGQTETLTFVIRVTDEKGGWVDQTVTVTINGTNDLPEIGDSSKVADSVTEAGHKTENGQQDEVTGKQTATGTISASDVDQPSGTPLEFKVQSLDTDVAKYGEFKLDGNAWTFTLDDTKAAVQALKEGQTETLTFVIRVTDEKGGWVDQTVTVTINGTNDLPEIGDSSKVADSVTEAGHKTENGQQDEVTGKQTATGTISASDVDQPSGTPLEFKVQSLDTDVAKYGEFKLDGNTWTFTLDDTKAAVQALKEGQTETLTFVIRVTDEKGGWVDQTVTVTINGTNDAPVINAQEFSYNENSAVGAEIGVVKAQDIDSDGEIKDFFFKDGDTLSKVSKDGYFKIDSSGKITLTEAGAAAKANNWEEDPNSWIYTVVAIDNHDAQSEAKVTLKELDVDDTPPPAPTARIVDDASPDDGTVTKAELGNDEVQLQVAADHAELTAGGYVTITTNVAGSETVVQLKLVGGKLYIYDGDENADNDELATDFSYINGNINWSVDANDGDTVTVEASQTDAAGNESTPADDGSHQDAAIVDLSPTANNGKFGIGQTFTFANLASDVVDDANTNDQNQPDPLPLDIVLKTLPQGGTLFYKKDGNWEEVKAEDLNKEDLFTEHTEFKFEPSYGHFEASQSALNSASDKGTVTINGITVTAAKYDSLNKSGDTTTLEGLDAENPNLHFDNADREKGFGVNGNELNANANEALIIDFENGPVSDVTLGLGSLWGHFVADGNNATVHINLVNSATGEVTTLSLADLNVITNNSGEYIVDISGHGEFDQIQLFLTSKANSDFVLQSVQVNSDPVLDYEAVDSMGQRDPGQVEFGTDSMVYLQAPKDHTIQEKNLGKDSATVGGEVQINAADGVKDIEVQLDGQTFTVKLEAGEQVFGGDSDHFSLKVIYDAETGKLTYFYTLTDAVNNKNGKTYNDKIKVTVTDTDGDKDTTTINVGIKDSGLTLPEAKNHSVEESKIDTTDATVSGNLQVNSIDAIATVKIKLGDKTFNVDVSSTAEQIFGGGENDHFTLKVSYNAQTGELEYSYTLDREYSHGQDTDSHLDNFEVIVTDIDGDRDTTNIKVTVQDDKHDAVNDNKTLNVARVGLLASGIKAAFGDEALSSEDAMLDWGSSYTFSPVSAPITGSNLSDGEQLVLGQFTHDNNSITLGNHVITNTTLNIQVNINGELVSIAIDLSHNETSNGSGSVPDTVKIGDITISPATFEYQGTQYQLDIEGFRLVGGDGSILDQFTTAEGAEGIYELVAEVAPVTPVQPSVEGNILANDISGADMVDGAPLVDGVDKGITLVSVDHASSALETFNGDNSVTITGQYGTLVLNSDGSYTYTLTDADAPNNATEEFTYVIKDADGDTDSAVLTINVAVTDNNPAPLKLNANEDPEQPLAGNVFGTNTNGFNVDTFKFAGSDSEYNAGESVTLTNIGEFSLNADGSYSFTPVEDWAGDVPTIYYTTTTGEVSLVDININAVADTPTLQIGSFNKVAKMNFEDVTLGSSSTAFDHDVVVNNISGAGVIGNWNTLHNSGQIEVGKEKTYGLSDSANQIMEIEADGGEMSLYADMTLDAGRYYKFSFDITARPGQVHTSDLTVKLINLDKPGDEGIILYDFNAAEHGVGWLRGESFTLPVEESGNYRLLFIADNDDDSKNGDQLGALIDNIMFESADAKGLEDTRIDLPDISAASTDADGSEYLTITLSGLPADAIIYHSATDTTGLEIGDDGSITLPADWSLNDLQVLTSTPGNHEITVSVTATETSNGHTSEPVTDSFWLVIEGSTPPDPTGPNFNGIVGSKTMLELDDDNQDATDAMQLSFTAGDSVITDYSFKPLPADGVDPADAMNISVQGINSSVAIQWEIEDGELIGSVGGEDVIELVLVDKGNGIVEVQASIDENFKHANGVDTITITGIEVVATDANKLEASGSLIATIDDSLVSASDINIQDITVAGTYTGSLNVSGADDTFTADLTGNIAGWSSSQTSGASTLTHIGKTVYFRVNADGKNELEAYVINGDSEEQLFTLELKPNSGEYELTVHQPLQTGFSQTTTYSGGGGNKTHLILKTDGAWDYVNDRGDAEIYFTASAHQSRVNGNSQGFGAGNGVHTSGGDILNAHFEQGTNQVSFNFVTKDGSPFTDFVTYQLVLMDGSLTAAQTIKSGEIISSDDAFKEVKLSYPSGTQANGNGFLVSGMNVSTGDAEFDFGGLHADIIDSDGDTTSININMDFDAPTDNGGTTPPPTQQNEFVGSSSNDDITLTYAVHETLKEANLNLQLTGQVEESYDIINPTTIDTAVTIYADGRSLMDGSNGGNDYVDLGISTANNIVYTGAANENDMTPDLKSQTELLDTAFVKRSADDLLDDFGIIDSTLKDEIVNGKADIINLGSGADTVYGGDDTQAVFGGAGNDTIYGYAGDDVLRGGSGNDNLDGGADNDILIGGMGDDTLIGGEGSDIFMWKAGDENRNTGVATDNVKTFDSSEDTLDISGLLQGADFQIAFEQTAEQTIILLDLDSDGTADQKIVLDGSGTNVPVIENDLLSPINGETKWLSTDSADTNFDSELNQTLDDLSLKIIP